MLKKREKPVSSQLKQNNAIVKENLRPGGFTKESRNFKVKEVTRRDMLYLVINETSVVNVPEIRGFHDRNSIGRVSSYVHERNR